MKRCLFLFLVLCAGIYASNEEEAFKVLPRGAVHEGDFFAFNNSIEISGRVTGDVYLFGSQVFIDGTVDGDVLAVGGSLSHTGTIMGSLRGIVGQLMVAGTIHRSLSFISGGCDLLPTARIEGSCTGLSGNIDLSSFVGENVRVYASNMRLAGAVQGDIHAIAGRLHVTSSAIVDGTLNYWSEEEAIVSSKARIGKVIHQKSFRVFRGAMARIIGISAKYVTLVMNFLYSLIVGFILIKFFPRKIRGVLQALSEKPLQCLATGVVALFCLPVIFVALLVSIVGAPFALTLFALYLIGFFTIKIFCILWAISKVLPKRFTHHKKGYFFLGLVIYFLLIQIPYFGIVLSWTVIVFGFGALVTSRQSLYWDPKELTDKKR